MSTTRAGQRSRAALVGAVASIVVLSAAALTFSSPPRAAVGNETGAAGSAVSPLIDMPDPLEIIPMEVPRDGSGAAPTTPPAQPLEPVLEGDPPAPALAAGVLVRGFPSVIPVFAASRITTSTVTASGPIVQGTLDATVSANCAQVEAFYQTELAKGGLASTTLDAAAKADSVSFTRGNDNVTLTLTPLPDGSCRYSVFAVLVTAS
ncbi:MAG: hypothetical protein JWM51_1051 [Microbacteriaceae bacterium]|jgi:hypothetical protein|nr:hypothetical protein [Microbacteriaceae bacterium]